MSINAIIGVFYIKKLFTQLLSGSHLFEPLRLSAY